MDARNSADNIFATTFIAPAKRWYNEMNWTRERPRVSTRKRYILVLSYAPDWLITFFLAALVTILADDAYGFRREFSLTDPSIQHTYAVKERVSVTLLAITTVLIPALIISAVSLGVCRSVWDWHAGLLGLVLTHAITLTGEWTESFPSACMEQLFFLTKTVQHIMPCSDDRHQNHRRTP
jgi:hypothetical protein